MKAYRWLTPISGVLITVSQVLVLASASGAAIAAPTATCDLRLGVMLTPDIPNPADPGFLSSLVSNHPGYRLTLRREERDSVLALELSGPGPESGCRNVIETMRRDARVLAVRVEPELALDTSFPTTPTTSTSDNATISDDALSVAIVTSAWQPEATAHPHLSLTGLGSLYWGAVHPELAWKVLAPVQSDDAAYADIQASCAASAAALTSAAPCP